MKLKEKRKFEEAERRVHQKGFTNLFSASTDERAKKRILEMAVRKVCNGELKTDTDIKDFILQCDGDYEVDNDKFKMIIKFAPVVLVLFIFFIILFQSMYV